MGTASYLNRKLMLCSWGGGIDIGTPGERAGREWHRKKGRGEGVGTQATTSREPEGAGKEKPNIKVKIS